MGIGKSGEKISPEKIEIKFGDLKVAEKGKISEEYDEKKLKVKISFNDFKSIWKLNNISPKNIFSQVDKKQLL